MRRFGLLISLAVAGFATFAVADQSSSDYLVSAQSIDAGGTVAGSTTYLLRGSAIGGSGVGADPVLSNGTYGRKPGFVGQLYRITTLQVVSNSQTIDEGTTLQLNVLAKADDDTYFAPLDASLVAWSVVNGPLISVSNSGVVTADHVYQDTPAAVAVSRGTLSSQLQLTVLNVSNDDFGAYAGDGVDDSWQVQYFGLPPNPLAGPNVDADGTGQTNLFKFMAGLNPLDGSRFTVDIQRVPGNPSEMNIIFGPVANGRSYLVQYQSNGGNGAWYTLTSTNQTQNGLDRTLTDLGATDRSRLYRVQISSP
jgi:hypothetical protein